MGKVVKTTTTLELNNTTVTCETGTVTSISKYLGDYTMAMGDDSLVFYKGTTKKKTIIIDDLDISTAKKKKVLNAIAKIKDSLDPYNFWFSFSDSGVELSLDDSGFNISDTVTVWMSSKLNSNDIAKYQSMSIENALSIDVDDIDNFAKAVVLVGVIIALACLTYASGGLTAGGFVTALTTAAGVL